MFMWMKKSFTLVRIVLITIKVRPQCQRGSRVVDADVITLPVTHVVCVPDEKDVYKCILKEIYTQEESYAN